MKEMSWSLAKHDSLCERCEAGQGREREIMGVYLAVICRDCVNESVKFFFDNHWDLMTSATYHRTLMTMLNSSIKSPDISADLKGDLLAMADDGLGIDQSTFKIIDKWIQDGVSSQSDNPTTTAKPE